VFNPRIFGAMRPEDIRDKRVLLSPLNWGMGHVSRCIGLMHQLLEQRNEIIIACNKEQEKAFKWYFPELTYIHHEGYPFQFGGKGNFGWDLAKQFRSLRWRLKDEVTKTGSIVQEFQIDVIVSDHRYGFYADSIPSIFITHQFHLPVAGIQAVADALHKKRMRPFDHIWIMDFANSKLSGKLTEESEDDRVIFVGPYSRFSVYPESKEKSEKNVVVVSGPEIYAQQLVIEMEGKYPDALFVCSEKLSLNSGIRRVSGNWKEQDTAILNAQRLISRSGYSTFMDLEILKIPALLYPTPGQAEQIYLHDRLTDYSEYTP